VGGRFLCLRATRNSVILGYAIIAQSVVLLPERDLTDGRVARIYPKIELRQAKKFKKVINLAMLLERDLKKLWTSGGALPPERDLKLKFLAAYL
jgi:hypothetical protein